MIEPLAVSDPNICPCIPGPNSFSRFTERDSRVLEDDDEDEEEEEDTLMPSRAPMS